MSRPFPEVWGSLSDIPSAVTKAEAEALYAAALGAVAGPWVEVGSWRGKSTCLLATAARAVGAHVHAVDPYDPAWRGVNGRAGRSEMVAMLGAVESRGLADVVTHHRCGSGVAAAGVDRVRLLWIDGDHRESSVMADLDAWVPRLAQGATVAFHDVDMDGPRAGLSRLVGAGARVVTTCGSLAVCAWP